MDPDPLSPQIVPASESDLPEIARFAAIVWRAHYPGIISAGQIDYMLAKMYSLDTLRDEILRRAVRYERLLIGGELAGFASFGPVDGSKACKLHKIYLHSKWRRRGLGSLLLRHCEREVATLGAECLTLTVNKQNTTAIAAYQRIGFAITDSIVVDIGGGFVMDDYVMTKQLG